METSYTYLDAINLAVVEGITEKTACRILDIPYGSLYRYKKTNNLIKHTRGKNPNSKKACIYVVDDAFFSRINLETCYWAGFIAADGNIHKKRNVLTITLQGKDKNHLELFKNAVNFDGPIRDASFKKSFNDKEIKTYYSSTISITSKEIVSDLYKNFNITPCKSKILEFPDLPDYKNVDAFIRGYIDGDGHISVYESKNECGISLISGSKQFITMIGDRIRQIINNEVSIYTKSNGFHISLSNKQARILITHLSKINTPFLQRKWEPALLHISSFSKRRPITSKYTRIKELLDQSLKVCDIAKSLSITPQAVYYHIKNYKK